jgi:hypothetical protein
MLDIFILILRSFAYMKIKLPRPKIQRDLSDEIKIKHSCMGGEKRSLNPVGMIRSLSPSGAARGLLTTNNY